MTIISEFIARVQAVYKTGAATEHSYRSAIEQLINGLNEGVIALNEPKRVACGAPDFIVQRGEIVVGHIEAKDLGVSLDKLSDSNKDQQARYVNALPNLIYTNCLDWQFFRDGKLITKVSIGQLDNGIKPEPEQFATLEHLLHDFAVQRPQTIKSPKVLAEMMAGKAALIKDVLHNALVADEQQESSLSNQYQAFREHLIHDISPEDFADIYAETIAYGMFAARLHDQSLENFSRQEALDLLPKTNPFLRSLFSYVAGADLDDRIRWLIDDLAAVFQAANVSSLLEGFGSLTGRQDPFLHFYETFLAAYNPAKRKARGVWYTPEAIVNFIVRAVDDVLKTEFGLAEGLADTSKITIDWDTGQSDKKGKHLITQKEVHRVQILDPATGTGTFLAEVVKQIAPKVKGVAPGMWSSYVEQDLLPRIYGFELLMASYAMCHMKLDMVLTELGYKPSANPPRLGVYLTNSLEEGERDVRDLFMAQWLTKEAREANTIKRQMPIMCVIGNPPYSGISHNMGKWITDLIEDYKYVDGVHFGERKHWLHDDYVKFIRLAESMIEKTGEGLVGMITNHGYLDNPTFRGMRWHLLNTFDKIYILDLHGNSKKKEVAPDGSADKNVFDIMQGVSVIVALKHKQSQPGLARVFRGDLWGTRTIKYETLFNNSLLDLVTEPVEYSSPEFAFVQRDHRQRSVYDEGFSIIDFMPVNVTGIVTARDGLVIDFTKDGLQQRISSFVDIKKSDEQVRSELFTRARSAKYDSGDSRGWKLPIARKSLQQSDWESDIHPIAYRPFDTRSILYRSDMVDWGRFEVIPQMLGHKNLGIVFRRQSPDARDVYIFCTSQMISDGFIRSDNKGGESIAPLYLYPSAQGIDQTRRINYDPALYQKLQTLATDAQRGTPDEVAVFDYIYGVLHTPGYRQKYAEFLKTDFPRIPWPDIPAAFWAVSDQGGELRRLHLMEADAVGTPTYPFTGDGNALVDKPRFADGKVWINAHQGFEGVSETAWDFYIGGYQPAQKWLKDRKGRKLSFDDIKHYQKIIKVLVETDRLMELLEGKATLYPPSH
jgi:predicted helicase